MKKEKKVEMKGWNRRKRRTFIIGILRGVAERERRRGQRNDSGRGEREIEGMQRIGRRKRRGMERKQQR